MNSKLIIIGAGGHGKVVAEIAELNNYKDIIFLDDGEQTSVASYPVVGKVKDAINYVNDRDFFVAIGNNSVRKRIVEELVGLGANIATLIHPNATVSKSAVIGVGTAVMAGAVINPCSEVKKGGIVNTCASIDHDCTIEEYSHLAVGVHVAGTVKIGQNCFLGAGAIIKNNVNVCDDVTLGAGAVVVGDITKKGTYIGVPAKLKD